MRQAIEVSYFQSLYRIIKLTFCINIFLTGRLAQLTKTWTVVEIRYLKIYRPGNPVRSLSEVLKFKIQFEFMACRLWRVCMNYQVCKLPRQFDVHSRIFFLTLSIVYYVGNQ